MNKINQRILLSIVLVFMSNFFYNLDGYYFTRENIPIVNFLIILGVLMTLIIEFYGTYLIVVKHILKED